MGVISPIRFPIWGHYTLGCILFLYTIQPWSLHFGPIPLQVLLVWVLFAWVIFAKLSQVKRVISAHGLVIIVLISIIIISVLMRIAIDGSNFIRLFQVLTGIAISIVTALFINDEKNRKIFLYFLFIAAVLSGFVAVMQYLDYFKFTWSRTAYYMTYMKVPSGLEYFPVAFSFSVIGALVMVLVFSFYDFRNKKSQRLNIINPLIGMLGAIVIVAGVLVSESRSGFLGVVISLVISVYLIKKTRKKYIQMSTIFVAVTIMLLVAVISGLSTKGTKFDNALDDKRVSGTWSIFMPLIASNPFGVPNYTGSDFTTSQIQTGSEVSVKDTLKDNAGYDPHNLILTTMLFYGIPAGFSLLFLYLAVIYKGISVIKDLNNYMPDNPDTILIISIVSANIAIMIHAWFHNANIVMGEMRGWFWIGSLVGLVYFNKLKLINSRIQLVSATQQFGMEGKLR